MGITGNLGGPRGVVETQEVKALEASKEASKEIPAKSKGLRRLLGVVAAEFAVVAALLLK
jgi:hypothetical protein